MLRSLCIKIPMNLLEEQHNTWFMTLQLLCVDLNIMLLNDIISHNSMTQSTLYVIHKRIQVSKGMKKSQEESVTS